MDHALNTAARMAERAASWPRRYSLLSQLVQGDRQGFALALADALEEHREHYTVGDRGKDIEAAVNLDVLGLACHAHRIGWPVPIRSPICPRGCCRGMSAVPDDAAQVPVRSAPPAPEPRTMSRVSRTTERGAERSPSMRENRRSRPSRRARPGPG